MKKIRMSMINLLLIAVSILFVLTFGTSIFAWFSNSDRKAHVGDVEINIPPLIYIRDDELEEMTSFNLDGLQINTEYNFVFCVAPSRKNIVKSFALGVIYTENIGMIINIYPVKKIVSSKHKDELTDGLEYETRTIEGLYKEGEIEYYFEYNSKDPGWQTPNVTYGNDGETNPEINKSDLNRGIHKVYTQLKFESTESWEYDNTDDQIQDESHYRFFIMRIGWDGSVKDDIDKEVDIVYVTTKGTGSTNGS